MLGVVCKFLLSLLGALVGFFVAAVIFDYLGFMSSTAMWHVREFYTITLHPITSLDWITQKTALLVIGVLGVNTLLLYMLFGRWGYKAANVNDPLAQIGRQQIAQPLQVRLNDQSSAIQGAPADAAANDYDRLVVLLPK